VRFVTGSYGPTRRSTRAGYAFAAAAGAGAALLSFALLPFMDAPLYVLQVGAVAVTVWYAGFRAGVVAVAVGWGLALALFVVPEIYDLQHENRILRWVVSLAIAAGVVWVSYAMRRGQEVAAGAALEAEAAAEEMSALHELTSAMSAAVAPADVSHALIGRLPALLGARGGAVALVEGDELVVTDPVGVAAQTHRPGTRFPIGAAAPIARATLTGAPVVVADRATFEAVYPDGAALTPYAMQALAVPLRVGGEVVGSMSFLFDREGAMRDDAVSVARIAADLGGQALERAGFYERERRAREALDRILEVAPRFHAATTGDLDAAICREARRMFGADQTTLWRRTDGILDLVATEPPHPALAPGTSVAVADFPRLEAAFSSLQITFSADAVEEARGDGARLVRDLGVRSSLRVPIVISGAADTMLVVSWHGVISEPDAATRLMVRRFADQAGLALEQGERRRAQALAALRADETRRLQEVTAALSQAATPADVSSVCLEHALEAVGADAGFVVLRRPEGGVEVELAATRGYDEAALEIVRALGLGSEAPFAAVIASGEPIWASDEEGQGGRGDETALAEASWATIPLVTRAGVLGALHVAFRRPRTLTDDERRWLQAAVSQCGQALERSRLLDDEQLMRRRAERLQSMTAGLSSAVTRSRVAEVAVAEIAAAGGAAGVALALLHDDAGRLECAAWHGYDEESARELLDGPFDSAHAGAAPAAEQRSAFLPTLEDACLALPARRGILRSLGHASLFVVPLLVGTGPNGLLVMSWEATVLLPDEERRFLESLAAQAAQALERARHFELERTIAETLQRSLLPGRLPHSERLQIAARYLPGTTELQVGGDWFDAMELPDGRVGLVVGDVVGKGLHAAASMGQLRNALRALSLDHTKPAAVVRRLNLLADQVLETQFATLLYVVVDPGTRVCWLSSAGHPPPVAVHPDGRVEPLEGGRGFPLGAVTDARYGQDVVELPSGALLVMYTDGLIERRGRHIDDGLGLLCDAVRDGPRDPERLADHVVTHLLGTDEREDDVALLVLRVLAVAPDPLRLRVPRRFDSLDVVRDSLRAWLAGSPLGRHEVEDVVVATWEACANAIEHAQNPADDSVTVAARQGRSAVTVVVEDTGAWRPPRENTSRGAGLRLMRGTMTSVDVATDGRGTRVTLRKELPRA
jgi:serine phosphatase RsbU (regulator of sigma subunit)/anti-sigma regulatory factor (Ser/Thr protein kinase)